MSNPIKANVTSSDVTNPINKSITEEVEKSVTVYGTPSMTPNLTPTMIIQDTTPYPLDVKTIDTSATNL